MGGECATPSGHGDGRATGDPAPTPPRSGLVQRRLWRRFHNRRAWLICGNEKGGQRAAVVYTLIENCRRAGVEPFAYLRDVLERLPATPVSQVAELTPHRWAAAQRAAAVDID